MQNSFRIIITLMKMVCTWITWPWLLFWERFVSEARHATTYGSLKLKHHGTNERNSILCSRAQMIEVCSEASFQPLLQLYLLLPSICMFFDSFGKASFSHQSNMIEVLQFLAVSSSILSLANSFTHYHVVSKRGALNLSVNPVGRIMLYIAALLQIVCRVLLLVMSAYCWGPGQFWQMFTCVLAHILGMSVTHFVWSRRVESDKNLTMRLIYNCLVNGVGNLYLHNMIQIQNTQDKKRKTSESTFYRQLFCDVVFIVENLVMAVLIGEKSEVLGISRILILCTISLHLVGLLMKWFYYCFFHLWRNSWDPPHLRITKLK